MITGTFAICAGTVECRRRRNAQVAQLMQCGQRPVVVLHEHGFSDLDLETAGGKS
jgi:hypothetical protein